MRIIAVDNHINDLERLGECLANVYSGKDEILKFTDPLMAAKYGMNNDVDIVYTEVDMRGIDGFALVELLKKHNPNMKSNIVTADNRYKNEAFQKNTSGYLVKPIAIEDVKKYAMSKY